MAILLYNKRNVYLNLNNNFFNNITSMKTEKIIILGKSGSGKDFLLKGLIQKGERYAPKLTTRPMRKGEKNGVDYNYLNNEEFLSLKESQQIKVYQKFVINNEDWYYGLTTENFTNNNLFIMTPAELSQISEEERKGCFVVYLDIDAVTRKIRIANRYDNNDSIDRRIKADDDDFKNFKDFDMKLTDPEFEIDLIYNFAM